MVTHVYPAIFSRDEWYRKHFFNKSIKKTLTIPAWLNTLAEKKT